MVKVAAKASVIPAAAVLVARATGPPPYRNSALTRRREARRDAGFLLLSEGKGAGPYFGHSITKGLGPRR